MTEAEEAMMPVIDYIIDAIMYGTDHDWNRVEISLMMAMDTFMRLPVGSPVMTLYKEWLECQGEAKLQKRNALLERVRARKD